MQALSSKDLALYCRFQGISLPAVASRPAAPSLLSLSAAFVHGLDAQMPSAVASMLRTTEKLQVCSLPPSQIPVHARGGHGVESQIKGV